MSQAAEITIFTSMGSLSGVTDLAAAFEKATRHKVKVASRIGSELPKALNSNEAGDIVANFTSAFDGHIKQGKVVAGSPVEFARAGIGVAVKKGAPKPDISTVEAYRATLLAAKSIGYSRGCSGQHVAEGIAQLGLTEKLKPKVVITGGGTGPVTFFLARGDFELGIQQTNIMVGTPGTDYVGPVPGFLNKPCPNSVALLAVSKEQDAARAMIRFMVSPEAAPLLRKVYQEPAKN
jgi:molybdate transport system substrate-binding protein